MGDKGRVMRRTDGGGLTPIVLFSLIIPSCMSRRPAKKHSHDESEEVEMEAMVPEQVDGEGLVEVGVGPVEPPAVVVRRESSESGLPTRTQGQEHFILHEARCLLSSAAGKTFFD